MQHFLAGYVKFASRESVDGHANIYFRNTAAEVCCGFTFFFVKPD